MLTIETVIKAMCVWHESCPLLVCLVCCCVLYGTFVSCSCLGSFDQDSWAGRVRLSLRILIIREWDESGKRLFHVKPQSICMDYTLWGISHPAGQRSFGFKSFSKTSPTLNQSFRKLWAVQTLPRSHVKLHHFLIPQLFLV